ncbi:LADA_0H15082g1_1 [Lachancea dasiensis]|uniref:LADA_0H15082g1_1 n=1 Tax=Lachancea dasiensis TaxID=1072105 RepID=A0A1G4K4P1_9SACH|nr:LADA_0H15082g1_1 [Lachancea dasiensis]
MVLIKEVALDLTNFVLSNVNDAISFKPQLCYQVPSQDYAELRERYIAFTGTSMRKNKSRLYFLPTNITDELQQLNPSIPESAKHVPRDGHVYYKNRLITELDYENVKRVELACAYIAYATVNKAAGIEVDASEMGDDTERSESYNSDLSAPEEPQDGNGAGGAQQTAESKLSPADTTEQVLRRGGVIGFRELGYLVNITPWHFHRVFKVITGLTIREYGQLCSEFAKKNRDIMNACHKRVQELKAQGFSYHCFADPAFLTEGSLCYEPTKNVVLLPQYFIDPNKSKEHKKKQKENKISDGKCTQRVEARKRRSSVMSGRIRAASQSSLNSNNSIQDVLQGDASHPSTPQLSPSDMQNYSVSASPVSAVGDVHGLNSSLLKSSLARSRKGSLVNLAASQPVPGKVGKPRLSVGSSGTKHLRHMSDPSIAIVPKGGTRFQSLDALGYREEAANFPSEKVSSPKVDFKSDIFGRNDPFTAPTTSTNAQNLNPAVDYSNTMDVNPAKSQFYDLNVLQPQNYLNTDDFQMDLNDGIAPNALNSKDNGIYSIGMPHSSKDLESSSQNVPKSNTSPSRAFSIGHFDDISLGSNINENEAINQTYGDFDPKGMSQGNLHGGGSFTNLNDLPSAYSEEDPLVSLFDHDPNSVAEWQRDQHPSYQQEQPPQAMAPLPSDRADRPLSTSYSRNRLNSVVPDMDDLDRMFLSGHSGMTPHTGGELDLRLNGLGERNLTATSQPSTRDNTMGTTATNDTAATTDTSISVGDFDVKNPLASYTNLGFEALSPCMSPTALDAGVAAFDVNDSNDLINKAASIETIMSGDRGTNNQFGYNSNR